ncbi:Hypothetical protein, putative [Bodo saltans]|uniref:Uncharacterized protein n=1 Tax=Bodo saltans TaxID=75058 RepID=A0A0S4ITQ0_BODSA|nr:Hypothetical protein, putative [Bodo saltans]|eukprot:CUG06845.1 Hypothetical protein, putative [Bodo saltans]
MGNTCSSAFEVKPVVGPNSFRQGSASVSAMESTADLSTTVTAPSNISVPTTTTLQRTSTTAAATTGTAASESSNTNRRQRRTTSALLSESVTSLSLMQAQRSPSQETTTQPTTMFRRNPLTTSARHLLPARRTSSTTTTTTTTSTTTVALQTSVNMNHHPHHNCVSSSSFTTTTTTRTTATTSSFQVLEDHLTASTTINGSLAVSGGSFEIAQQQQQLLLPATNTDHGQIHYLQHRGDPQSTVSTQQRPSTISVVVVSYDPLVPDTATPLIPAPPAALTSPPALPQATSTAQSVAMQPPHNEEAFVTATTMASLQQMFEGARMGGQSLLPSFSIQPHNGDGEDEMDGDTYFPWSA